MLELPISIVEAVSFDSTVGCTITFNVAFSLGSSAKFVKLQKLKSEIKILKIKFKILDLKREIENTNKAVTAVTGQIEQVGKSVSLLQSRYDTIQAAVRNDRDQISHLESTFYDITLNIADMEDRSRRSNVRLVDLREGVEGDDCIAFLKANLPKWIPSIADREIKIECAHRIYSDKKSKRP